MTESKEETMNESKNNAILAAARAVIDEADFRTAMHGHECIVRFAEPGEAPHAQSRVLHMGAREAGLPKAYQKKAPFVAFSRHEWVINNEPLVVAECRQGVCVLIGDMIRVRQGRGTSLVCEKLVNGRWQ